MLLHQLVDYHAQRRPHHPALTDDRRAWSYQDLATKSHCAARLLAEMGVAAGDRIAVLGLNSAAHLAFFMAASRIGAVAVSVNFRLAPAELAFILDEAKVDVLCVTDDSMAAVIEETVKVRECATRLVADLPNAFATLTDALDQPAEPLSLDNSYDENGAVLQLYTSGTTGRPKGAVLSHRNLTSLIQMMSVANDGLYDSTTVNLVIAPLFHIGGSGVTLIGLAHGAHNVLKPAFDPLDVVETIVREKVSTLFMVPAMIQAIVKLVPNVRDYDFSSLDTIAYGAAPISASLLAEAVEVFGCDFSQVYGMTETTGTVVSLSPEDHRRAVAGEASLLTSCGRACPGNDIKIIDDQGNTLGPNQTGEICLRSASNMLGYYNRPEATDATLQHGWVITGDAGFLDDEGYLFIRDRLKDMVVSGGENIYPVEVENVLAGLPGVIEVAVIGIPDETYGEALLAVFAMRPDCELDTQTVVDYCRDKLAGFKIPRQITFVDALPRNPSGKILKTVLREPYWQGVERRIA